SGGLASFQYTYDGNLYSGAIPLRNTIVAGNSADGRDPDVTGFIDSQGHNLIGVLTANATGPVASDLYGLPASRIRIANNWCSLAFSVKLHYFAGLKLEEAGELLGLSPRTAYRHWAFARAWLFRRLGAEC